MRQIRVLVLAIIISIINVGSARAESAKPLPYPQRPRLIVTLVVDQFRADYLTRFESRFLPAHGKNGELGGFRYLMKEGAYYPFAQYDILHSTTGPGHSTILSGSYPYQNGIPVNYWFDPEKSVPVYCTADPSHKIIGIEAPAGSGASPRNLLSTTVGDEIKNAGIPSRVISLALKDRAAILMGGHRADLALWFENKGPGWVSSQYYVPGGKLPDWLARINEGIRARKDEKYVWNVSGRPTGYSADDSLDYQPKTPPLGKSFPHEVAFGSRESFATPLGTELLEKLAEKVIEAYDLGNGKGTDLLALSLSNHDYMAHAYGANSLQMEEMTVAEDRQIAKLLNFLRIRVPNGLKDVVIVLTADHGAPLSPEWLKAHKVDAGRIKQEDLAARINSRLNDQFGKPKKGDWMVHTYDLEIFLNQKALGEKGLDPAKVQAEAKKAIIGLEGVAHVFTEAEYREGRLPPLMHGRQALKTFYPGRSGEIVVIPKPYWVTGGDDVSDHLTGYNFDRTVPLILVGAQLKPGVYPNPAEVVDLAPTLSFISGVMMPSLSEGRVLFESFQRMMAR